MATNKLAKKLWQHFNLEAKKIGFCATEYKALSYIPNNKINKTLLSIGESMIGYWNSISANGVLTLGPRSLMTTYAEGRIVEGKSRVWISPAPVGSDITIVIKKIEGKAPHPGRAAATVLAEKFDDKGNSMERLIIRFTKGKYEERKTITFSNNSIGFIIITVDTKLVPGKSFAYKIKYQENVIKSDTKKHRGF